jgi:hypothetical protein
VAALGEEISMATRDTGYYLVHYTNLDIPNANEVKTGTSPAYWDGSFWNLYVDTSGFQTVDSNIDHVSPRLTPPNGPSPMTSPGGWHWIKPRDYGWRVAWNRGYEWFAIQENLMEQDLFQSSDIEAGPEVQQQMVA